MKVELVSITQPLNKYKGLTPEEFIIALARVSNPKNQFNHKTADKLLNYCIRNKHWSVFEPVSFTFEIETSIPISKQLIRHRSATFQETSRRYTSDLSEGQPFFEPVELRKQASKNRQSSTEVFNPKISNMFPNVPWDANSQVAEYLQLGKDLYDNLLEAGVARESARFVLPQAMSTRLYMTNNVRNWIHFLDVRDDSHAQKEVQLIAKEMKTQIAKYFPYLFLAMGW